LVVVLSIPTLVAVSTLASVGVSFVAGGLFAFVIGVLEAIGIFPWPDLSDVPPFVAIFLGSAMVLVGMAALVALRFYFRFVVRAGRLLWRLVKPSIGPVSIDKEFHNGTSSAHS
jgi:hypothetical protein